VSGALAMATGFGGRTSRDLARVGLTLAPQRRAGRRLMFGSLLVAAAFAGGFGASELAGGELLRERPPPPVVHAPAAPTGELAALRHELEQSKMALQLADARGQELERQIDTLNQKLTEATDELTFFRKAREGKKH
jgi:hypothetical protein